MLLLRLASIVNYCEHCWHSRLCAMTYLPSYTCLIHVWLPAAASLWRHIDMAAKRSGFSRSELVWRSRNEKLDWRRGRREDVNNSRNRRLKTMNVSGRNSKREEGDCKIAGEGGLKSSRRKRILCTAATLAWEGDWLQVPLPPKEGNWNTRRKILVVPAGKEDTRRVLKKIENGRGKE